MSGRQAILNKIKEAVRIPTEIKSVNSDLDKRIKNGIESVTPKSKDELWIQFQKELEAINGEFRSVKNISEAVDIISRFLSESKFERIGTSKENICIDIAERVQRKYQTVKIVLPENLEYEERKKEYYSPLPRQLTGMSLSYWPRLHLQLSCQHP